MGIKMKLKNSVSILLIILIFALTFSADFTVSAAKNYEAYAKKLDKTTYTGELGAIYSKSVTIFRVWSPDADAVRVKLFRSGSSKKYTRIISLGKNKHTGVWAVHVAGDLKNTYYTFLVTRKGKTVETSDIYAKACGVNGKRSMVVDLNSTNPKGWENDTRVSVDKQTDARIWEIQINDFSSSQSSGVSKKHRGKYLAFTEKGTTVNSVSGSAATCVDYLKNLGVNYVQINPFYDFGSIDESKKVKTDSDFNWGYDPVNYNCPEGSYSTNPNKGAVRIKECKRMIQALHNAGIGVIMDVVYNHTQQSDDSPFNKTVPDYYYRKNSDGSYSNGSGCGNDTASERKMFRKFMIDSVTYWAKEYHIDGFRFDLMGLHDVTTMNKIRESLDSLDGGNKILMYGEAWNLETSADNGTVLANQNNVSQLDLRIGAFDDTYRDAVKGSSDGVDKGFVQDGLNKANLKLGILAQSDETLGWSKAPSQCVTYASCHDNLTLWDKLIKSVKGAKADYTKRYEDLIAMNKLAGAITYTSQGISFMLAGEELCRTKKGDKNSYKSGVKLNQIDWENVYTFGDVSDYYKGLMEIRKNIPAFTDSTKLTVDNIKFKTDAPDGVVAYSFNDSKYKKVVVIFNSSDDNKNVSVKGSFIQLANDITAGMANLGYVNGNVNLPAKSAAILVDSEAYESNAPKVTEGKVLVRYHSAGEVFKSYVLNGEKGSDYKIEPLNSVLIDYNVKKTEGDSGQFGDSIRYCDIYCDKYDGTQSSVTFNFIDDKTEKNITDSIVMTNRQGQPYETLDIPAVDGYTLNLQKLPKNGCGVFTNKNQTVNYRYSKSGSSDNGCKVNIIYMADDGKILGTDSMSGDNGTEYKTATIEIDGYKLKKTPDNINGTYSDAEQTVLYIYTPSSFLEHLPTIIIVLVFISAIAVIAVIYYKRRKAFLMKSIDIS